LKFNFSSGEEFEAHVRRIAYSIWSPKNYAGSIVVDGKERDGIFENDNNIFCLEVTVSKQASKAEKDCQKLDTLVRRLRGLHPDKGVTGWFVTRFEPTGEQGAVIARFNNVNHQTVDQFFARMVNANEYLTARKLKPFGSIRNPSDDRFDSEVKYVPTKIVDINAGSSSYAGRIAKEFSSAPVRGVILGEYGAGKSMALRDIFYRLAALHHSGTDSQFPVYINLRDHIEQYEPDECLRRHATSVGLQNPEKLIQAWRSGYVYLLLDGFDELAPRIATRSRSRAHDLRRSALSLVKRFVEETPKTAGMLLAGRNNYFDSDKELFNAAGITDDWKIFEVSDLDDADFKRYIEEHGESIKVPSWVPRKPLLISYILQNKWISEDAVGLDLVSPFQGWDYLIDKICEREVSQVYIALDRAELRSIYGRMATKARRRADVRGPLSFDDCRTAFIEVTGVDPEERSITALLRLPGMTGTGAIQANDTLSRGARWFVDEEFADALAAVDLNHLIRDPNGFDFASLSGCKAPLGDLAIGIATKDYQEQELFQLLNHALMVSSESKALECTADILSTMIKSDAPCFRRIILENLELGDVVLEGSVSLGQLELRDCYFAKLRIDVDDISGIPKFNSCAIEHLEYVESIGHSMSDKIFGFDNVEHKEEFQVDFEFLRNSGLPDEFIDLASIIDKVFIQSIRGRQYDALFRGRPDSRRQSITDILENMTANGWVYLRKQGGVSIVHPQKSKKVEARELLLSRNTHHYLLASK